MIQNKAIKTSTVALWGMVAILLFAGAVAISQINVDAVWFDEARTYQKVNGGRYLPLRTPIELVEYMLEYHDTWPPLYNLTFAGWGILTGWSVYAHRVMAWLFGLLSIAVMYRFGTSVASKNSHRYWVGLLSAGLLCTSAFYMYYLHEMRGYTMSVFLMLVSVWLYWRLASGHNGIGVMSLFVLSNVCLLYTHYITAMMLGGIGVHHLTFGLHWRERRWWELFGLLAVSLLSLIPWGWILIPVLSQEGSSMRGVTTSAAFLEMIKGYGNGLWIVLPLFLVVTVWRVRGKGVIYLWVLSTIFLFIALSTNVWIDYLFHPRHAMGLLPIWLVLVSLGMVTVFTNRRRKRHLRFFVFALIVAWFSSGIWGLLDRQFMASNSASAYIMTTETLDVIWETSETCITERDKAVFYLTNQYSMEYINNLTLLHYLWTDVSFEYAMLNELRHIPSLYDLRRAVQHDVNIHTMPYEDRVVNYIEGSEQVWFFSRQDLPRDERVTEFESVLGEEYAICERVRSEAGLDVYVWGNEGTITCPALERCTDATVKVGQ